MSYVARSALALAVLWALSMLSAGCSAAIQPLKSSPAQIDYETQLTDELVGLPPPAEPTVVTVYRFRDQTGQYKPGVNQVGWSTAVTQGATSMLIQALRDAGQGRWFTVLERESLSDLLNERRIIRDTRKEYKASEGEVPLLPPLLFSPIILSGGIIAFESDLLTGGIGARYMGIGGSVEYRRDMVTVYLRATSVKNGAVLETVTANKTIFSLGLDAGVFKFVDVKGLLEVETGFTTNEPPQMAVLEAIQKAVEALVIEGAIDRLWSFADPEAGQKLIARHLKQTQTDVVAEIDGQGRLVTLQRNRSDEQKRAAPPRLPVDPAPRVSGAAEQAPSRRADARGAPSALPTRTSPEARAATALASQRNPAPAREPAPVGALPPARELLPRKASAPMQAGRSDAGLPYLVQLGSYQSSGTAEQRWTEMARSHADLFADREPLIRRADLGPEVGVRYRLQVGLFASHSRAAAFCRQIQERQGECFVVHNASIASAGASPRASLAMPFGSEDEAIGNVRIGRSAGSLQ